ncbi:zinc-binding alcohol dehydrogenase family protein [Pediococcus siamensis]|uniref:zinc-binding alcohol dehydrogenase family protein n=1 Tax=Pediococcus siamensis TaxID=381829 RepID=UPI00399FA7B5
MHAVGLTDHLPISDPDSLKDVRIPKPVPKNHDLLVAVQAVSVNPVDIGVRKGGHDHLKKPKVLGWDAYGIVEAVGDEVTLFHPGDKVYYAGSIKRAGSNSDFQLVDERIVGTAPQNLSPSQIAAMPLTSLTAYEALFEQLKISFNPQRALPAIQKHQTILIISGAGGVGSVATQLAHLAGLTVVATASRPESQKWVFSHGADYVVNHRENLVTQVRSQLHERYVDNILELNDLDGHWDEMCELIKPSGKIASITENRYPIDLKKLTKKRATFVWEWMYTKSYFQTPDLQSQHDILEIIARLLDKGILNSTLTKKLQPINAANLRAAHQLVETNHMLGKIVVSNPESKL